MARLNAWISPEGKVLPISDYLAHSETTHFEAIQLSHFAGTSAPEAMKKCWVRIWLHGSELNIEGSATGIEEAKISISMVLPARPSKVVLDVMDPNSIRESDDDDDDAPDDYDSVDVTTDYDEFLGSSIERLTHRAKMMEGGRRRPQVRDSQQVHVRGHQRRT